MKLTNSPYDFANAMMVVVSIVLAGIIIFIGAEFSKAFPCDQDPATLSPEMRKAYEQLKEMEKEVPGMKVEIRCDLPKKVVRHDN